MNAPTDRCITAGCRTPSQVPHVHRFTVDGRLSSPARRPVPPLRPAASGGLKPRALLAVLAALAVLAGLAIAVAAPLAGGHPTGLHLLAAPELIAAGGLALVWLRATTRTHAITALTHGGAR